MFKQPAKILQIVPRFPPDVDGVGDYTLQLAQQLRDYHQIRSDFLVFRPNNNIRLQVDGFAVHPLETHTVQGFLQTIPTDLSTAVLQYSNYPYLRGKLDAPTWLAPALLALKARGVRIVVMFHELPTLRYRRIRCPNPIQRRISRALANVADVVVTNNVDFQQTLSNWVRGPVHCIPNFSTIGEPDRPAPLSDRTRALIVFGSSDRTRVYRNNTDALKRVCQRLGIHTLYDIGRPTTWDFGSLATTVKVIETGFLPANEVSGLMSQAFAGVFDYHRFPRNLAKSTVYAAYCAHGLLPICNGRSLPSQDGIVAGQHYLATAALQPIVHPNRTSLTPLQTVAADAHQQYLTRTLAEGGNRFASLITLPLEPLCLDRQQHIKTSGATRSLVSRHE